MFLPDTLNTLELPRNRWTCADEFFLAHLLFRAING